MIWVKIDILESDGEGCQINSNCWAEINLALKS